MGDSLEEFLRRKYAALPTDPPPPIDDICAHALRDAQEDAAAAHRRFRQAQPYAYLSAMLWYGLTEYSMRICTRNMAYLLDNDIPDAEGVVKLRGDLKQVLEVLGEHPETNNPNWWPAFLLLVTDETSLAVETLQEMAEELAKSAKGDWPADRILDRARVYRERMLPLWQSLLDRGGLVPSDPVKWLPRI